MEKMQEQSPKQAPEGKSLGWDCESSLYDSFELKSFKRQLDSAIASRSYSMHRLPEVTRPPVRQSSTTSKRYSKISRSLNKFLRSVFRPKPNFHSLSRMEVEDGYYVVYQRSGGVLTTIPEAWEMGFDALGHSLVTRTTSERFTSTTVGVSCG